ncbi:MAG: hypothetical protein M0011_07970 [Elusimicrobia bacterium]|nr:hypothetical protein [Elusimicrobiota bacterium]
MSLTPGTAALYGALAGTAVGWLSRLSLKRVLDSSAKIFYSVFAGGILARLLLLSAAICLLRHESNIIIILFSAAMILVQMVFEAFPLKHGTKRNP